MVHRTARLLAGFSVACLIVLAPLLYPSHQALLSPQPSIRTPAPPTPVPQDLALSPAGATGAPTGRWLLCVSVDPSDELDTNTASEIGVSIGTTAAVHPLLSLRYNSSAQGARRVKETARNSRVEVLDPTPQAFAGVGAAFSACSSRATGYDGVVFCEARHCPMQEITQVIRAAAHGIAMNERHTVFAAVSRVVATLGVFEENLFPAIDGLAVDYAIRWHLMMEPQAMTKLLLQKVRRIAHRRRARTIHDLVTNIGHPPSLMSVADLDRRERCNPGHVLGTKYLSNRMKIVNGGGFLALIQTPLPPDRPFRRCVMTGGGVRRQLCGERRHCILDGFFPGLTVVEQQLQKAAATLPEHSLQLEWQYVLAARIGFLLKLAKDQPWREDIVHGVVMTVTPKDIAAMKDTVLTYDAPIKMFTVLLSGPGKQLAHELRFVAGLLAQDGVRDRFRFFHKPDGVPDVDGWSDQIKHIFRRDPTSQWAWIAEPTVSLRPSYLACFAKDTTSVQSTHSYSRLHVRPQSVAIMRSSADRLAAITKAPNSEPELDRGLCSVCRWDHCVVDQEGSLRADCDAADVPVRGDNRTSDPPCCHRHDAHPVSGQSRRPASETDPNARVLQASNDTKEGSRPSKQQLRSRAAQRAPNWTEAELSAGCPVRHPAKHGLVNTGRSALVLYTFTSHANLQDRQIELDNYLFFQAHGVLPPDTPTALFSAVDYIFLRSDLDRHAPVGNGGVPQNASEKKTVHDSGLRQCAESGNVRFMEAPSSPCDLCGIARTVTTLGGPDAVAESYEYIVVVNSGTRGPFYSEAPRSTGGPSPVTWIDDLALGGEKVYTGAIMTGSGGSSDIRPYLQSFALAFPGSAMIPMHPVFVAGCSEGTIPKHWWYLITSFDGNLHKDTSHADLAPRLATIKDRKAKAIAAAAARVHPSQPSTSHHDDGAAEKILLGLRRHVHRSAIIAKSLRMGAPIIKEPWPERKMKCVYRCELQLVKTVFESTLPPVREGHHAPRDDVAGAHHPPTATVMFPLSPNVGVEYPDSVKRPHLTANQKRKLSPLLSTYLDEGHFLVRSLHHNATMVNMGHAAVVVKRTSSQLERGTHYDVNACDVMFLKFGGAGWRGHRIPASVVAQVQRLTLVQWTSRRSQAGAVVNMLQCPNPHQVRPLR